MEGFVPRFCGRGESHKLDDIEGGEIEEKMKIEK